MVVRPVLGGLQRSVPPLCHHIELCSYVSLITPLSEGASFREDMIEWYCRGVSEQVFMAPDLILL